MNNYDLTLGYVRRIVTAVGPVETAEDVRYLRSKPGTEQAKLHGFLLRERESLQNEVRTSKCLQPQVSTLVHSLILIELLLTTSAPVSLMAVNSADPGNDKRHRNVFLDAAAAALVRLSGGLLEVVERL
ncbi:MAG TPA: hypothetical protein VD907_06215 [Verrucomicrobiae bacterium]|nr:hypothetical protein [Verrucomicrobiae bacterium]